VSKGFEDGGGRVAWLHDAFGDEVATLEVDVSPLGQVMRDGAALRTRRRLALASGVTALVVLPVAAVAAFGTGSGTKPGPGPDGFATGKTSSRELPPPPKTTATMVPPGQHQNLPNDEIVVLSAGTFHGQHWRLVRDRFVVAGPEGASVMDDPTQRPHLPFTANWGKHGTIECDFTGIQWGDDTAGSGPGDGGACNPTDDGPIDALHGRFNGGPRINISPGAKTTRPTATMVGRIDGTDVAWVTVAIGGGAAEKVPVIVVPGEENDYFVFMVPTLPEQGAGTVTTTAYDGQGRSLGSQTSQI
jgi:hypothetical protein